MQNLLEDLHIRRDKKSIQQWITLFQRELDRLEDKEKSYYYLLLAEVYAVKLRDMPKAQECLKNLDLSNDRIIYEHRLRLCYFRFLQGDYEQAINDLNLIKVTIQSSASSKRKTIHFFGRIVQRNENDILDEERSESIPNRIQDYEFELIKALKFERSNNLQGAKKSHMAIYNRFSDISPSIKYEAAKHLLTLQIKTKGKPLPNQRQYENAVNYFEKSLNYKDYYIKKLQYLHLVLDILEESEQDQMSIHYQLLRNFVFDAIDKNMSTLKDNAIKARLRQLRNNLQEQNELNRQICFNFIGQKTYKQILKNQQQQKSKIAKTKPKQSSIKPAKVQIQMDKPSRLKETNSVLQNRALDAEFTGSYMTKINMNSGGFEERYFYIKQDFLRSKKLYYCSKRGKQEEDNDFYRLKGFKKIEFGKKSKALNRKQCEQFQESHCFTLKIDGQDIYERNFYVREQSDLNNWIALFQMLKEQVQAYNVKKTLIL